MREVIIERVKNGYKVRAITSEFLVFRNYTTFVFESFKSLTKFLAEYFGEEIEE